VAGPIATKWNFSATPTLYLIDHKGVIRYKWTGPPGEKVLDAAIEAVPLFVQTAHSWLCLKASNDTHEYEFLAAILEDVGWVSPGWRPHLPAASVHYFHGDKSPDNPVIRQAREALRAD
jgi:hypothetical protein